jgi:hypothetical protein
MDSFKNKQKSQETKYALDQEQEFKVQARRNKLLGLWAADKLHLDGEAAESYAKEVVIADFEEPGDEDVYRKVKGDFDAKGLPINDEEIREAMAQLMETARQQIAMEMAAK